MSHVSCACPLSLQSRGHRALYVKEPVTTRSVWPPACHSLPPIQPVATAPCVLCGSSLLSCSLDSVCIPAMLSRCWVRRPRVRPSLPQAWGSIRCGQPSGIHTGSHAHGSHQVGGQGKQGVGCNTEGGPRHVYGHIRGWGQAKKGLATLREGGEARAQWGVLGRGARGRGQESFLQRMHLAEAWTDLMRVLCVLCRWPGLHGLWPALSVGGSGSV